MYILSKMNTQDLLKEQWEAALYATLKAGGKMKSEASFEYLRKQRRTLE